MADYEMAELVSVSSDSKITKPSLLKRKLGWPAKKILRSLPFKVLLIGLVVLSYWGDVGLDTDSAVQWFKMRSCYRYSTFIL